MVLPSSYKHEPGGSRNLHQISEGKTGFLYSYPLSGTPLPPLLDTSFSFKTTFLSAYVTHDGFTTL